MTPKQWAKECLYRIDLAGAEASATEVVEVIVKEAVAEALADLYWLLKKCEEIVDDDLEERPARHSLGRLHAELERAISEIIPAGTCLRCRGKGVELLDTEDEKLTWPCPACKQDEIAKIADKSCQGCKGLGVYETDTLKRLACSCVMTATPLKKKKK
jgi:hypothetical protein